MQIKGMLRRRLNVVLKRTASRQGIALAPACEQRAQLLIATALERMSVEGVLEREDKVFVVEQAMQRLIVRVSSESMRIGTFPVADDTSLDAALRHLCPLWPYC